MKKQSPSEKALGEAGVKFLDVTRSLLPHWSATLGFREDEGKLGENHRAWRKTFALHLRESLDAVEAIPEFALGREAWLDRRGLLALLRGWLFDEVTVKSWERNPQTHPETAVNAVMHLLIRNQGKLKGIEEPVLAVLKQIPRYLEEGFRCLRAPVPVWRDLAVKLCEGVPEFFEKLEEQFAGLASGTAGSIGCRSATKAFVEYGNSLAQIEPGDSNGFSLGRERFEFLMRERLGLDWSLPEAMRTGEALVAKVSHELEKESRKFGRRAAPELIEGLRENWEPPTGSLIESYRAMTLKMRARFEENGVIVVPKGESLVVEPVPSFLRHQFPTAAYLSPGPFDSRQKGVFWVNDLSAEKCTPAEKRTEISQHFGLELTCAHEAYPGHHLQFVMQNRHPRRIRRLFAHSIYYEGWTLWCEKLCVDLKFFDAPHAKLLQLHDALWRAHRIVIDCGLHSGEMSFSQAVRRLCDGVGFTKARATGDVNWYSSSPTVPMSYLLGRIEVERLHRKMVIEGGSTLAEFHRWLLGQGSLPPRWLWQAQMIDDHGGSA